ncbi:MAG: hypothetical protein A2817_01480 [Candidatus Yanofskybacteria bacterium RIFCSPHIGHO2_01_FULL_39_8b]|uniref:Iron transporter n=1 Tax=Candidatus Yanofskybacteria bacterium RIFCSPHIGHO2_01_FULL_39_8b TaxID=1802659 RepID=A0A1F8E8Y3_9BACT|nr:MAG: hypothetical protein A2817_01480 [Candidatus Yanofskybacteria bacterium RIFCSPHIGHO2_01_FULL_39_8b]
MVNKLKKIWKSLGPGFVTGASDDDPSGVMTYAIAGARFGNLTLWTMLYILPLMIAVQEMSARIGISSGCGLAGNIKKYYSKSVLFFIATLIIVSNTFNIGADVFGMASAIELLTPGSTKLLSWVMMLIILFLVVILPYRKIVVIFKILALSLFAYMLAGFLVIDNWQDILKKMFLPHFTFNKDFFVILVAIIGTTISPYLAFWQASEEAEERKLELPRKKVLICKYNKIDPRELNRIKWDTRIGMFFSNLIGFFIIALMGTALFGAGINDIATVRDAAEALKPLAGEYAYILFSIGIISAGLLTIPILAGSSAYVLAEIFNWKGSLNEPFSKAKEFYGVIIFSTIIGMVIPYTGISAVQALFWTALIHGIVAPFLIALVIHMANNKSIVGQHVNKKSANIWGALTLIILLASLVVIFTTEFPVHKGAAFLLQALF